jgi:DNA-binding ferritin-like protein
LYVDAVLAHDMRLASIDNHGDTRAKPRMSLNRPLADTLDLSSQLKQIHGNATGAQFCSLPKCANRQTRGFPGFIIDPRHKLLFWDG